MSRWSARLPFSTPLNFTDKQWTVVKELNSATSSVKIQFSFQTRVCVGPTHTFNRHNPCPCSCWRLQEITWPRGTILETLQLHRPASQQLVTANHYHSIRREWTSLWCCLLVSYFGHAPYSRRLWHCSSAASAVRLPPSAVRTATTTFHVRSSGLFCGWPGGLNYQTTGYQTTARSITFLWQFSSGPENFFSRFTSVQSACEACDYAYKSTTDIDTDIDVDRI